MSEHEDWADTHILALWWDVLPDLAKKIQNAQPAGHV